MKSFWLEWNEVFEEPPQGICVEALELLKQLLNAILRQFSSIKANISIYNDQPCVSIFSFVIFCLIFHVYSYLQTESAVYTTVSKQIM